MVSKRAKSPPPPPPFPAMPYPNRKTVPGELIRDSSANEGFHHFKVSRESVGGEKEGGVLLALLRGKKGKEHATKSAPPAAIRKRDKRCCCSRMNTRKNPSKEDLYQGLCLFPISHWKKEGEKDAKISFFKDRKCWCFFATTPTL